MRISPLLVRDIMVLHYFWTDLQTASFSCKVAPTRENIQCLQRHLATPRCGEYHLCKFSSCLFSYEVWRIPLWVSYLWELISYTILEFTVFSNILKDTQIHILANTDEHEVVQQLKVIHHSLKCLFSLTFRTFTYSIVSC